MKWGKGRWTRINLGRKKWQQLSNRRGSPRPFPCRTWQPSRRQPRWWSTGRAPWTSPCCISPVQGRPFHPPTITLWWYSTRRQAFWFFFSLSINFRSAARKLGLHDSSTLAFERRRMTGGERERKSDSRSRWCKLLSRITCKLPREQQRAIHRLNWMEKRTITDLCLCVYGLCFGHSILPAYNERMSLWTNITFSFSLQLKLHTIRQDNLSPFKPLTINISLLLFTSVSFLSEKLGQKSFFKIGINWFYDCIFSSTRFFLSTSEVVHWFPIFYDEFHQKPFFSPLCSQSSFSPSLSFSFFLSIR